VLLEVVLIVVGLNDPLAVSLVLLLLSVRTPGVLIVVWVLVDF
jgi:hypothetical protein